jgi:hypothetical protein
MVTDDEKSFLLGLGSLVVMSTGSDGVTTTAAKSVHE